ncbi:MAG: conjugative transfer protein TraD, partial [Firmicutes bacterium]|nr:conjugative transfer protein TraD [Bacillota bacterium]
IREQANEKYRHNLFILNIEQYSTLFKPLMTLCLDMMIRETLSLPDSLTRRIWFIIDELGTLYRMDSVIKLETVGRSKGGCLICANQDLGRIEEMYGRANLKSFFNNFNTNFTFRIREPETAEFLSKAIGDQQLIKTSHSRQMSPSDAGDRRSENEQERTERLVMPVEFQGLKDLEAVVNIAGFGVSKITVPPIFYEERHPNFVLRKFEDIGTLQQTQKQEHAATADPLASI